MSTATRVALAAAAPIGLAVAVVVGVVIAIAGASFGGGCTSPAAASDTTNKPHEIPPARLRIYHAAAHRFDIDWAFLASIGAQECNHGTCAGDNGSGCAGPMQIAVRPNSPCSPGDGPTLWDRYGVDADHDGKTDPDDPADAIFTAARILRQAKHAPPAGGSYKDYYNAACGYYGACGDSSADYADQVMARAVTYGFGHDTTAASACAQPEQAIGTGELGDVVRDPGPGGLAPLPAAVTSGARVDCDRRIRADVIELAQRFHVRVTACYAIHTTGGEHPLGAAIDLVPDQGRTWPSTTERLARTVGWKRSCAAAGVAPACAQPPFRFVGYDGYPGHGDPQHCRCAGNAHLHLSWLTSASSGQRQAASRTSYFAPSWIDVFSTAPDEATS